MIAESLNSIFASARDPLSDFWYRLVGTVSAAGVEVTVDIAMQVSTVFACIRFLAETIASLPCHVKEQMDERKKRMAREHWLWRLLHERPNVWQTPMEWRELGLVHLCLRGNWYNRIVWNFDGTASALIPLNPDRVEVQQLEDGRLRYVHRPNGQEPVTYSQEQILHVRGLSTNGVTGMSVIEQAANAIGLAAAQETHGSSLFKNGSLPAFWIKRPAEAGKWTEQARNNFRGGWRKMHAGPENAHNPPILEDGMTLESLGLTNEESQWLESRGFQGYEICRFFRIPPHVVGILDRSTNNNIEHQGLELVIYTLMPWLVRMEQAYKNQLIGDPDSTYFVKHNVGGLLRGDIVSRYNAYNVGIQAGFMTRNEARELEDWDALEDLDEPLQPLNMVPAGTPPEPAPTNNAPQDDEEDDTRATSQRPAFEVLIDDAANRIAAAEIRMVEARADKAADDRQRWDVWVAGQYGKHLEYLAKTITPIAVAWEASGGQPVAVESLAAALVDVSLHALKAGDPVAVLGTWATSKAETVAATMREAFQ